MIKLSPSILAADFTILGQQVKEVDEAGVPYIHLDVMDGLFVPAISFGMPVVAAVRRITEKILDVHLMITQPERYVEEFVANGADMITFHQETCATPSALIDRIHSLGARAGMAVRPDTPVADLLPCLEQLDMALIMSVCPGFGGQQFIPEALKRIETLRNYIDRRGLHTDIQVDGGIYQENVRDTLVAGANVIVAGTAIFSGDITENVKSFENIFRDFNN